MPAFCEVPSLLTLLIKLYQGYFSLYSQLMSILTLEVTMFKHYTTETMHRERNMAKLGVGGLTKREQFYIVTRLIVFRIW